MRLQRGNYGAALLLLGHARSGRVNNSQPLTCGNIASGRGNRWSSVRIRLSAPPHAPALAES